MTTAKENPDRPASTNQGSPEDKQMTALTERVKRNHKRVSTTRQVIKRLESIAGAAELIPLHRVRQCSEYLAFNNYYQVGQIKLASANFCKVHQICSQCAQRRATKYAQDILQSVQNTKFSNLQLITLTVRNSHDLHEVLDRLYRYFKILLNRFMRRNVKDSFTRHMVGGVWTIEITYNTQTGWHPHIHGLIASTAPIYTCDVRAEWESISDGDSFICDSTPIQANDTQTIWDAVLEVSKYTLKNSTLEPEQLFEIYRALKGKQLIRRFGTFTGKDIQLNPVLTDFSEEPFYQYVLRYFAKQYKFDNGSFGHYKNAKDYQENRKWNWSQDDEQ
jgi:hypothetical protein